MDNWTTAKIVGTVLILFILVGGCTTSDYFAYQKDVEMAKIQSKCK